MEITQLQMVQMAFLVLVLVEVREAMGQFLEEQQGVTVLLMLMVLMALLPVVVVDQLALAPVARFVSGG